MTTAIIQPSPHWRGTLKMPGDKSISHRAIMLSALADGSSLLTGLLKGEDVHATMNCFRAMGVKIEEESDTVKVHGVGLKGLKAPQGVLDCGNSGTTMRLMMGLLAAQPFVSRLTGDASLNRRPMGRVIEPLRQMGAQIEEFSAAKIERVIRIQGQPLRAINYELPVASAQVKSAILLAGLYAQGVTKVTEPMASRDHTELMLQAKGVAIEVKEQTIQISSPSLLKAQDLEIPGDISSAAFFLVAGAIAQQGDILLQGVGINPTRTGILEVLKKMGAQIELSHLRQIAGEAVADLRVQNSQLRATEISGSMIPKLIDEIPILAVAAARAQGVTKIRDAAELRVKESDRISHLASELKKFSIPIKELEDGMDIPGPQEFQRASLETHLDHRIAMSCAMAASQALAPCRIASVECIKTSYPDFWEHYLKVGGKVTFEAESPNSR